MTESNSRELIARALAESGHTVRYPKGTVIITQGDPSDALYVILSGRVKVYLSDDNGREVVLAICGPGDYLGELALVEGVRSASVATLEPCTMSYVTQQSFKEHLKNDPGAAFDLVVRLIGRLRLATEELRSLALMDVYGRVARLLLELAVERDGQRVVEQPLTQQQIAERVACSREMISRVFKELTDGGYIRVENRRIYIDRRLPARF
ncbi:Crp/Fnr family transcriptional regulator [Methylotetracoccus oryzae]|uniref:Crp/Fnr family transcriptional regulator n=1 Tax=Methylotetracoccus oryzae TaxID=1919059 RepID=UPI00111A690B|nr:cyclic nucleotide-binding domain-containing protein [Methylotetracoccus oryzae]